MMKTELATPIMLDTIMGTSILDAKAAIRLPVQKSISPK